MLVVRLLCCLLSFVSLFFPTSLLSSPRLAKFVVPLAGTEERRSRKNKGDPQCGGGGGDEIDEKDEKDEREGGEEGRQNKHRQPQCQ